MPEPSRKSNLIPGITGDIHYTNPIFTMPGVLQPYKVGILSYSASLLATFAGYPLDSIKTRMQTHPYKNALHCFKSTINNEGIRGLFRGIVAPLLTTSFSRSLTVSIYTSAKPMLGEIIPTIDLPEGIFNADTERFVQNFPISFASGLLAGASISIFACPFELTKIFQQIVVVVNRDSKLNLKSNELPTKVFDVAENIIKYEGWKGLYSGFAYHLTRDAVGAGLFYSAYETVKLKLQSLNRNSDFFSGKSKDRIDALCVPFSGALSGAISWVTVFPIDTIKANYQKDVLNNIIRVKVGLSKLPVVPAKLVPNISMYKGFGPSITRSMCVTMVFFSTFEYLMQKVA